MVGLELGLYGLDKVWGFGFRVSGLGFRVAIFSN